MFNLYFECSYYNLAKCLEMEYRVLRAKLLPPCERTQSFKRVNICTMIINTEYREYELSLIVVYRLSIE